MPRINNNDFFQEQIKKFGTSHEGVNWGKRASQIKRFEVICDLIPDIKKSSILDLGCGFGDFYTYLKENHRQPTQYLGVDSLETMVNTAKKNVPQAEILNFIEEEIPKYDYIIASGSLNILTYKETYKTITKAFSSANKAFIFNILSTHADFYEDGYNYFSPTELLGFCMSITKNIQLRADYMPHDFTISMNTKKF